MKKTYMQPTHEVVRIETAQAILAGSVEGFASGLNTTGGSGSGALAPDMELDDWD